MGHAAALMSPGAGLRPTPPPLLRSAARPTDPIFANVENARAGRAPRHAAEGVGWATQRSKGGGTGAARSVGHERSCPPGSLGTRQPRKEVRLFANVRIG